MSVQQVIIDSMQHLIPNQDIMVKSIRATVDSVNEDERTISVTPIDDDNDNAIEDISLLANNTDGFILYPEIGSEILIGITRKLEPFVLQYSDVYKVRITINDTEVIIEEGSIKLNGDNNGGIVKIGKLKTELQKLNSNTSTLKTACIAAFTALSALDGSASLNAFNTASTLQPQDFTGLENTTITHGS